MVRLTRIYTKTGDKGKTGLAGPIRLSKSSLRIETIGEIDEANASIGWTRQFVEPKMDSILSKIQQDLFDIGADLAVPEGQREALRLSTKQVESLENLMDDYNELLKPLSSFVLPGGSSAAASLHCARTIVRRAERRFVAFQELEPVNLEILKYLNRLSDLLFILARVCNDNGAKDVLWVPGKNIEKQN